MPYAMTIAVVAEKPSVARDLAAVLGADRRGEGFLHGSGYVVTWAVGHLVALAEPHQMNPAWRVWRRDDLPILPERWPLVVLEPTKAQFEIVRRILRSPKVGSVICATDAGREGELIFRLVYEATECDKPVQRLWISSLTPDAIRAGFARLEDARRYDRLALAARARSRADWLVGMNLSRAYTLWRGDLLSIGRVQTPTLALLVERERAIRAFVPEDYFEVVATFSPSEGATYTGTYERTGDEDARERRRLPADGEAAAAIIARAQTGQATVASVDAEVRRLPPPRLYDLAELQRDANRLFGFTAQHTLDVAQALYERHKLLSYPRTDSRHLSTEIAATLPAIVRAIEGPYRELLAPGTGERALGARFVDNAKVGDHHAIVPTTTAPSDARLSNDERRLYDLVCRRLLAAWHDAYVTAVTTIVTAIRCEGMGPLADPYKTVGTTVKDLGWRALDLPGRGKRAEEPPLPPDLAPGQSQTVVEAKAVAKKTEPPPRYTEATLLTAMETAGRTLEDRELSEAMRDVGLGTPATRAAIIETLLARAFVARRGKLLEATDKGIGLIDIVHAAVKSPAMTGEWEAKLKRIERGAGDFDAFMAEIAAYVRDVVTAIPNAPTRSASPFSSSSPYPSASSSPPPSSSPPARPATEPPRPAARPIPRPPPTDDLATLLKSAFGFAAFRPHQEAVCRAVTSGRDALLVMPTGAGKSLCYQLPGLARGGTTLVVSPLLALIEDQVEKLCARGLRAERVHSGRDRAASREACRAYVEGSLDYLFIAPERLAVPGFADMLAARPPALVAIDEAHCISHWGHDFRTEYRMLGSRLTALRPAPILALTATATPRVQDDIVEQLGMPSALRFVHGFRRTNLALEAIDMPASERPDAVASLLARPERRPAIVYVPTRKQAEALAAELPASVRAAAYHAGMRAAERDRVQAAFVANRIEVIVATIAFGMGIDKPDIRTVVHTALPASVEGYYQEIGRAGRDGAPARAVLLHAYADLRTQEYFLEKSYPEVGILERAYTALGPKPKSKDVLRKVLDDEDDETIERALEQLWIHGGALIDSDEMIRRGDPSWRNAYAQQRAHREEQLANMARFPEAHDCRMLHLVRHFGDREDDGRPCGLCDVCDPSGCVVRRFARASAGERAALGAIVAVLSTSQGAPTLGQLHRELAGGAFERRAVERLVAGLASAGLVRIEHDAFEKDGRRIPFARVALTVEGQRATPETLDRVVLAAESERRAAPRTRGSRAATKRGKRARGAAPTVALSGAAQAADAALRSWRLEEARRTKVPAFRIMTDRTLLAIASIRPTDSDSLAAIPGVGPAFVRRFGRHVVTLLRRIDPSPT